MRGSVKAAAGKRAKGSLKTQVKRVTKKVMNEKKADAAKAKNTKAAKPTGEKKLARGAMGTKAGVNAPGEGKAATGVSAKIRVAKAEEHHDN